MDRTSMIKALDERLAADVLGFNNIADIVFMSLFA